MNWCKGRGGLVGGGIKWYSGRGGLFISCLSGRVVGERVDWKSGGRNQRIRNGRKRR